jgi:hypothetical protein
MVVGLNTTYPISAYQYYRCEFESRYREGSSSQHYVIKFVRNLRQVSGFIRVLRFSPPIQTDHHDITEILLNVKLNTKSLTLILITTPYIYTTSHERKVLQI